MPGTSDLVRDAAASMPPITTEVSVTLPVAAPVAFEVFADAGETPRWLSVVQAAQVLERGADGRPLTVSFRASFDRATIGYVLHYRYLFEQLTIAWATGPAAAIRVEGEARFTGLSQRASLMTYRLSLELPVSQAWLEAHYDGHAASAVVGDFREHLRRFA